MKKTYAFLFFFLAFSLFAKQAHAALPDTFGPQRTLVVFGNLTDASTTSTIPQLNDLIFNKVNNYYNDISAGQMSLVGDVIGPYNIAISSSTCVRSTISNAVVAAVDPDVDFNNYDRLIIVIPVRAIDCGWGAISTLGKVNVVTAEGTFPISYSILTDAYSGSFLTDRIAAHEYAHQLGIDHADYYDCGSIALATSTSGCSDVGYADRSDNMGGINNALLPLDGAHLDMLGWLNPLNEVQAQTGDYTLSPAQSSSTGVKFLKIPRSVVNNGATTTTTYMWVEYNQPLGYASMLASFPGYINGATIHVDQPFDTKSYLVGATSPSSSDTPDLLLGSSFTDPLTASKVRVVSVTPSALTLHVDQGKTDFDLPTVSITYPTANDTASGTIIVTADASDVGTGVQKVEFYTASNTLLGTAYSTPYNISLNTANLPNGTNYIKAVVYDNSGQAFGVADNSYSTGNQQFTVNNSDIVSPITAITVPSNNSYVYNLATITAVASDNVGISSVSLYKDNSSISIGSCSTSPCTKTVVLSNGAHTLYSVARDFAGNTTKSDIISVTAIAKPTVSITAPTANSFVQGTVAINANASSSAGISKVEFYVDGALLGNDIAAPYTINWNTVGLVSSSTHTLVAKAYDTIGLTSSSTAVNVIIADTTKPSTSITSPANNAQVTHGTNVTISASATDDLLVSKVEFYVSNVLKCTDTSTPYTCVWGVPSTKNVVYQLQTKAYDAANNIGTSTIISVTSK